MDVVVVGATGNVGTAVLDALSADPVVGRIRAVARRSPGRTWPKTSFHPADVAAADLTAIVAGADAVVHLAWLFQPARRATVTWEVNVGGSNRLFEAVVRQRVPVLVYSSSVGAYTPAPGKEVDESWRTDGLPTAAYGREKAYVERLLDTVEASDPARRVVRIRPGFVFQRAAGPEQLRLFGGPLVPPSLLEPGALPLLPFPRRLRFQGVHAADLAQAFRLAVTGDGARGAYNVAADPVIDGAVLARILGARLVPVPRPLVRAALALAWTAHVVPVPPPMLDLAFGLPIMRTDRARRELGWVPQHSAAEALAEALAGMAGGAGGGTAPLAGRPPLAGAGRLSRARRPGRG
jgi:nucleoside-diphosphate-sugar epimerase